MNWIQKIWEPMSVSMGAMFGEFVPKLIGALIILLVGWFIARCLGWVVSKIASGLKLNDKLGDLMTKEGDPPADVSRELGKATFWTAMLFVAIGCLRALELDQVSAPLIGLLNEFFAFLPNLIGAAVLFAIAWLVAKLARTVATKALQLTDLDTRLGLNEGALANTIPTALFCFILLFFLPGVLGALQLEGLTGPVSEMVNKILDFIPNLISALIVLGVFYFIGKLARTVVANLLNGVGFNNVPAALGLSPEDAEWKSKPADLAGRLAFVVILFLGISQAVQNLKLDFLTNIFSEVLTFGGPILVGTVILAIGLWLANLAKQAIHGSSMGNAATVANIAYAAIMVLSGAVALRRMGLADDIVNMAFGLTLGAVAIAAALAFGLGGRDAAAKFLERKSE